MRQHLPITPGVYIYKNQKNEVIYIGKAKNLKNRVNSYFHSPIGLGPKTRLLVSHIHSLEYIEVLSDIEALLLESKLINKFKPQYNIISKDDKSPYYIHITGEVFPKPLINHEPAGAVAGPFLNNYLPKSVLSRLRHVAPYCLSQRPVKKPCFYYHLGLCSPCPGQGNIPENIILYRKNIQKLTTLLKGNFSLVQRQLTREMHTYSQKSQFEKAQKCKEQLDALSYLTNTPINPEEYFINPNLVDDQRQLALNSLLRIIAPYLSLKSLARIEMLDIAHLQGTAASAGLVVAVNGQLRHDLYRHFNIQTDRSDSDVDMMKEVVIRRLKHPDWPLPDLLVLDGGKPQVSVIKEVTAIPVISLAKQQETIVIPVSNGFQEIKVPLNHPGLQLLQQLRDEAHRFSRRLHHQRRSRKLIGES